jgi:DNA-nicking Smr family endonuclease
LARRTPRPDPRNPFEPLDGAVAAVLDLHGFRATEARARVDAFLRDEQKRHPGGLLHIITGKGRGSERGPVLKKTVATLLRDTSGIDAWGTDLDGGGYLVRLKQRGR